MRPLREIIEDGTIEEIRSLYAYSLFDQYAKYIGDTEMACYDSPTPLLKSLDNIEQKRMLFHFILLSEELL